MAGCASGAWVRQLQVGKLTGLLRLLDDSADPETGVYSVPMKTLQKALFKSEPAIRREMKVLEDLGCIARVTPVGRPLSGKERPEQSGRLVLETDPTLLNLRALQWHMGLDFIEGDDLEGHEQENTLNSERVSEESDQFRADSTQNSLADDRISTPVIRSEVSGFRAVQIEERPVAAGNALNSDRVSESAGPPTPPYPAPEIATRDMNSGSTTGELIEISPSAHGRAREENPLKSDRVSRPKPPRKELDDEGRRKLHERWDGPLHGADEVDQEIERALGYKSAQNNSDMFLYCNNWLRKEATDRASRRQFYSSNGRLNGHAAPPSPTTPRSGSFSRFANRTTVEVDP